MRALDKLKEAKEFLATAGVEDASREAELIISYWLGIDRVIFYKDNPTVPDDMIAKIDEFLKRRSRREPLQYILGYTEFHGLMIKVGRGVLIPRPETELLAEEAIKKMRKRNSETASPSYPPLAKGGDRGGSILDLCTGSGCIALALGKEFPETKIYGTDTSAVAIKFAEENAAMNGIKNVTFLKGNLFEPIRENLSGRTFDLIVSNPPYIKRGDIKNLQPDIREWEPSEALDGGEDGFDYYEMIIPEAKKYLKEDGYLILEIGISQAKAIEKMAVDAGYQNISLIKDYSGIERIFIGRRSK
jgi:release factor glutamine methyltransferase